MTYVTEKERQIPVAYETDVLVCGGGFGGISAALAAARAGKKVLLCEREFALGGLGTLGLVTIYLPLCDGNGRQVSYGIAEELLRLSIQRGADTTTKDEPIPTCWLSGKGTPEEKRAQRYRVQFNPWFFASDAEELLEQAGVTILYGADVCGVDGKDGAIQTVFLEGVSGRIAARVRTVIDASGSAVICRLAGEETAVYPTGNLFASWYYYHSKGQNRLRMHGPSNYLSTDESSEKDGKHFTGLDLEENTQMLIYSRRRMIADIERLREKKEDPDLYPITISTIPEQRMTCRIIGREDFLFEKAEQRVESSIGCIGNWHACGGGHEIPYGSLVGKKIRNLITAGRVTSADPAGWDLTRVIPACAVTGQAAGMAAALTEDFASLDVSLLQNALRKEGVVIHLDEIQ